MSSATDPPPRLPIADATARQSSETPVTATCPYCHADVETSHAVVCETCDSSSHRDCWEDGGGCAVVGCGVEPPATEAAVADTIAPSHSLPETKAPAPVTRGLDTGETAPLNAAGDGTDPSTNSSLLAPLAASFTYAWKSRRAGQIMLVGLFLLGLPALAVHGTTHNWFSGVIGQVYLQADVDEIREAALERGEDTGYARGEAVGRRDGYRDGLSAGRSEGYMDGQGYDHGQPTRRKCPFRVADQDLLLLVNEITSKHEVTVCQTASGDVYYKGAELDDPSTSITLPASETASGAYRSNSGGYSYIVGLDRLTVLHGGEVILDEPFIDH